MEKRSKMLVLGCGNMAQAIIKGLHKENAPFQFFTYTPSIIKAQALAKDVDGVFVEGLSDLGEFDYYMIACKPQQLGDLACDLNNQISKDAVIVSILAGTTVSTLEKTFSNNKIVRIMPNTPGLVGLGVNAFYFSDEVSIQSKNLLVESFKKFSEVFSFDEESKIDKITGFSGSGPAYIFEFARIMIEKMKTMGIEDEVAANMVKHTFLGASKLMVDSEDDPETLRNKVTSNKGVTYEALKVFKNENIENIFDRALDAAYNRTLELSKGEK